MILKTGRLDLWCVLVTGASGFVGRRLVPLLAEAGAVVIGIDTAAVPQTGLRSFHALRGDFRGKEHDVQVLLHSFDREKLAVIHLAGMAHVGECERNPQQAFDLNVELTASVLEFCRENNANCVIFPSTGLVYGDKHRQAVDEQVLPSPPNLYAATKLAAESLVHGYGQSYGFAAISARLANVYGPGGNPDTVISSVVRKIRNNEDVVVRDGTPVRDFIYVDDVAESLYRLLLVQNSGYSGPVNISTGVPVAISRLVEMACAVAGQPAATGVVHSATPPASSLIMNNALLQQLTGWTPGISLADGLSIMLTDNHRI